MLRRIVNKVFEPFGYQLIKKNYKLKYPIEISKEERESGVLKNEELIYKLRDHSLFTGYAPYDNPKYAITVVAEHMGNGSKVAAPIAKKIMDFALNKYS